jgi:hypothetical protein
MKTRVTLLAGQKGTKALHQKYGDAFYCVRYRYDEKSHKQYKTVEIIVSQKDWFPPPARFPKSAIVPLKIGALEKNLQVQVKSLRGRWNPEKKVWYNHAIAQAAVTQLEHNGHKVRFHDLHKEKSDPLLAADEIAKDASLPAAIKVHCDEMTETEGIIIVHPNWWGGYGDVVDLLI